ncbi:hypothetical protein IKW73_01425 [Candidatus Saccharibacteria bacterium]|nr:hypothetical protein [Candidatus Saccharibacteria bacterium]
MDSTLEKNIARELKIDLKGIGVPEGAAVSFVDNIIADTKKALKGKNVVTEKDLTRIVAREAKKYNPDLAYVYKNRDKII